MVESLFEPDDIEAGFAVNVQERLAAEFATQCFPDSLLSNGRASVGDSDEVLGDVDANNVSAVDRSPQ